MTSDILRLHFVIIFDIFRLTEQKINRLMMKISYSCSFKPNNCWNVKWSSMVVLTADLPSVCRQRTNMRWWKEDHTTCCKTAEKESVAAHWWTGTHNFLYLCRLKVLWPASNCFIFCPDKTVALSQTLKVCVSENWIALPPKPGGW